MFNCKNGGSFWVDSRAKEAHVFLRAKSDQALRERALGRAMGSFWEKVQSALQAAGHQGYHLGTASGSVYIRAGRELWHLLEIKYDRGSEDLAITGCNANNTSLAVRTIGDEMMAGWRSEVLQAVAQRLYTAKKVLRAAQQQATS